MGHDEDFDRFVRESSTSLFRTAVLLADDFTAAQDLLQTAYERTWRHWRSVAPDDPTAYARRALANAATDSWRRRRRLLRLAASRRAASPEVDELGRLELRPSLMAALRTLPMRQRTVLVLRYWEDMSEIATADAMGTSVGTVKSQASRGLAALRAHLDQRSAPPLTERTQHE